MNSLKEIKAIIAKFPEASGVGFVVGPALIRLAAKKSIPGYKKAFESWVRTNPDKESVGEIEELTKQGHDFFLTWDGPAIIHDDTMVAVGIKETIELLEDYYE